jgi:hypothetical protein
LVKIADSLPPNTLMTIKKVSRIIEAVIRRPESIDKIFEKAVKEPELYMVLVDVAIRNHRALSRSSANSSIGSKRSTMNMHALRGGGDARKRYRA